MRKCWWLVVLSGCLPISSDVTDFIRPEIRLDSIGAITNARIGVRRSVENASLFASARINHRCRAMKILRLMIGCPRALFRALTMASAPWITNAVRLKRSTTKRRVAASHVPFAPAIQTAGSPSTGAICSTRRANRLVNRSAVKWLIPPY